MLEAPQPKRSQRAEWTVGVFMVGEPELGPAMQRDLLELERAGSSKVVNVLIAVHDDATTAGHWFELGDKQNDGPAPRIPIDDSKEAPLRSMLAEFLSFMARPAYKADHYFLVLWGHASGLGFGGLQPGNQKDQVSLQDLAGKLRDFRTQNDDQKLDILGFCACAVNKAEYALELAEEVEFLVSSQVGISTQMTWPFDELLNIVLLTPSVQPEQLAYQVVQSFEESYEPPPVALTALDLRQTESLQGYVRELSDALLTAMNGPGDVGALNNLCILATFLEAIDAYPYEFEPMVDFFDFCRKLVQKAELALGARGKARKVLEKGYRSFVVHNARSGPKMATLNGLSIIAPNFNDPNWSITKRCSPDALSYAWGETRWPEVTEKIHAFDQIRKQPPMGAV